MGGRRMKAPTQPKKDDFSTATTKAYDGHKRRSRSPRVDLCDRGSLLAMLCSGTIAHIFSLSHVQIAGAWAAPVHMSAAPMLLAQRPPLNEICEAGIAIVPIGEHWGIGSTTSRVNSAAPLLLLARPISLPIRKAIRTIKRIDRAQGRRHCRRNFFSATDALELTTAGLLAWAPLVLPIECIDFTFIHWPDAPNHCKQAEQERQYGANAACEVPSAWHSAEVAAITHKSVRRVCYVSSLPAADICQVACRAHASITNATCSEIIMWSNTNHRDGLNHGVKQPTTCD